VLSGRVCSLPQAQSRHTNPEDMRNPAVNKSLESATSRMRWHRIVLAPQSLRRWLADDGSLTRRLKAACRQFRVIRLAQGRGGVCIDEVDCIQPVTHQAGRGQGSGRGGPRRLGFLVREVLLECDGLPTVFAHSVIDAAALRGRWRWLAGLGTRPLGEALFRDPQVRRGALAFRQLRAPDARYRAAAAQLAARGQAAPAALWARRSVFRAGGRQLLVTEVFLPAMASLAPARETDFALPRKPWRMHSPDDSPDGR